ncbi:MAG: hypothetical protein ABEJ76_03480 [Halanaeroarchaeum sp.]
MALLPVDEDVLEDVCESIARKNYGFLYVSDYRNEIKSAYESADTGLLNARALSGSDLREALASLANDEFRDLEQIRDGVFYFDPFGATSNEEITDELTHLFSQRLVVTAETLRSRFSLAIDDIEFFVDELADRDYVRRIRAGKKDYYTIGPGLKEHADDVGLDARLQSEATHGKISHSDLESVIDVAATTDVIRYLDREGYIVDLDGEYLVEEAIDEYGEHLAKRIEDTVADELADSSYVLRTDEFEQVVENEAETYVDLGQVNRVRSQVVDAVQSALESRIGLERDSEMVVESESFDALVDDEARRILGEVKGEYDVFGSPSEFVERAEDRFEDVHVATDPTVNEYVRSAVADRYEEIVNEEEF